MTDLLIFPFGGNAREAIASIRAINTNEPTWNILGFIDDGESCHGDVMYELPVLGGRERFAEFPDAAVLAVPGSPESFRQRPQLIAELGLPDSRFATIIDPSVRIGPGAEIGINTLIMANVVLSCSVRIGNHCVVLPNTVISHDTQVDDFTLVGSNTSISGQCHIGRGCYIGSGAKVREQLTIGDGSLLGLGAVVVDSLPPGVVVVGNPATVLRSTK
jgi:sugar O-acyltransferase (sialic acid O-acetyltransferase NeuD family)